MCKELYLCTSLKIDEIASKGKVPPTTLKAWIRDGKWVDERRKLEADLQERSAYEISKLLRENVGEVVRRHLETGKLLEEAIADIVRKANKDPNGRLKPGDLMDLGKAFNQSARITGTTVGTGRIGKMGSQDNPASVSVLINTNFSPKPTDEFQPTPSIDVEAEEVTEDPDVDPECGF